MGSLKNADNNRPTKRNSTSEPDLHLGDTESQFLDSPSPFNGMECKGNSDDELQSVPSPGLFDDTVPFDDVETQAVDLGGETQLLYFGGETQAVDDLNCDEDVCTQLFDDLSTQVVDTDDEGTERTEVLGEAEELTDVDSAKRVDSYLVNQENVMQNCLHRQFGGESKSARTIEECNTGPHLGGFTSLRVASIRASGLASHNTAQKGCNSSNSCSLTSDCQLLKQHDAGHSGESVIRDFGDEIDQRKFQECDVQIKGSQNENNFRVIKSVVRKLFTEDTIAGKDLDDNMSNADLEEELPPLFTSENDLAGLSYVDSQEPGEASQAIALDFVDKFLKVNLTEFDQEVEVLKSTGGKSKPVARAMGTKSFAKSVTRIFSAAEGIYDWDDNREDEGGGEFFRKKKETFFDNGHKKYKSFIQPRDPKYCSDNCRAVGLAHSDSKFLLQKSKKNNEPLKVSARKFGKNLIKQLDEQSDIVSREQLIKFGMENDSGLLNVGFDTQMAAEAMEALCFGAGMTDNDSDGTKEATETPHGSATENHRRSHPMKNISQKRLSTLRSGIITRQAKNASIRLSKKTSSASPRCCTEVRKQCGSELLQAEPKRATMVANKGFCVNGTNDIHSLHPGFVEQSRNEKALKESDLGENDGCHGTASSSRSAVKKRLVQEQLSTYRPIACRTRHRGEAQQQKEAQESADIKEDMSILTGLNVTRRKRSRTGVNGVANGKGTNSNCNQPRVLKKTKLSHVQQSDPEIGTIETDSPDRLRRDQIRQKLYPQKETNGKSPASCITSNARKTCTNAGIKRITSSVVASPVLPSMDGQSGKRLLHKHLCARSTKDSVINRNTIDHDGPENIKDLTGVEALAVESSVEKNPITISSAEVKVNSLLQPSRKETHTSPASACTTPLHCVTMVNEASPICMGDEYHKQSCRKNLSRSSLTKEIRSLASIGPEKSSTCKYSRKRRDIAKVQVLFSRHLDGDVIKQQQKILARLGASIATSMSDATHFVADEFVRTRNMLEAIAFGKPVVTHLWLVCCGQASCLIDERNYILRDSKKEKEFGFSLPVSLARACQHPLLEGKKVLITLNTKPGKDILARLVKAVHGMAVERIGRSAHKDDKVPDNLLVLSCEEDYGVCVPFLEKGAAVYSSELLLNGIVTQKLEYERHRLFADHVRSTRSTIWLIKDVKYIPIAKR